VAGAPRVVPFVDLPAQIAYVRDDIEQRFSQIIDNTSFILREHCARFEREFSAYLGAGHTIGVGNGTDALVVALKALGVGADDEVITAANTFIATAEAIVLAGARPVLVDVDPDTYTIDPDLVEAAITPRTKVIIPVHLYGRTADLDPIVDLAERHGLRTIEDAAQAHGARHGDRRLGTIGALGCFSFYPTKNLGAFGDAGGVVTDDPALADRVRMLRDHGGLDADQHDLLAQNSRMDAMQAAVLSAKLPYLDEWNGRRRRHAARYTQRLEELGLADRIVPPQDDPGHVYHIYVTRVPHGRRDELLRHLRANGVGAGIHYPAPIHRTKAFAFLGIDGALPVAERLGGEILSLPMHAELSEDDIEYVCQQVAQGLAAR
jgi:dTDP-4-amino-4,6-dideoxygalactose transaminase